MDPRTLFVRYRPYLAILVAIAALILFLPGHEDSQVAATGEFGSGSDGGAIGADGTTSGGAVGSAGGTGSDGTTGGGGTGQGGTTNTTFAPGQLPGNEAVRPPADAGADCDPKTGRIKVPTIFAPPCVAPFNGNNGASTYQGVTATEIKVVYFQPETDPAVDAALTAAHANNTPPQQEATMRDYVDYFNHHYETYGRKVVIKTRHGSGKTEDDAVARADALTIAKEDKPFAVFGSPTSEKFVETLAANKILCICTTSQPQELYEKYAPYVGYTTLMASTQGYIHRAEYVGKRLAFRKARWAGTSSGQPLNTRTRKFGLLWYDTPDHSYTLGVRFFERELKEKYGVTLAESLSFPSDYGEAAQRTEPLIQRLKNAGVTSVIFSGDPISPALFTKEATKQLYFPEWIVTGSALTDTTLFARTYDQQQWRRAFGISFLTARVPNTAQDPYYLHMWHFHRPPTANNQYGVIYPTPFTFFTGVHMAGPNLTVQTWQRGLFAYPLTGAGRKTSAAVSYGRHGIWPFTDYTNFDDVTEIWWDPNTAGKDEVGNSGAGMYRYVAGGKRYLPGQHPTTDPFVFNTKGTVTVYNGAPPGEGHPNYEHHD